MLASTWLRPLVLALFAIPAFVNAQEMREEVSQLAEALAANYVFPEVAERMVAHLGQQSSLGAYENLSQAALAEQLTTELQGISNDKHLDVMFDPNGVPDFTGGLSGKARNAFLQRAEKEQQGFTRVEMLEGDIGLIEITEFYPVSIAKQRLEDAMLELAHAKVLVFDVRKTRGGQPDMVASTISYLFTERVHLNDLYRRVAPDGRRDVTDSYYTTVPENGLADAHRPVYVLTSSKTFSAGEEFAYDLKHLRRAILVGEVTGGGANPGGPVRLSETMAAFVPNGRAINPITKTNWEGVGVQPHIAVPADEALDHVLAMIREH